MEDKFSEKDKERVIQFLNFVAKKAKFSDITVQDNIDFYGLLNYMQTELIPKIDKNILEVVRVVESKDDKEE